MVIREVEVKIKISVSGLRVASDNATWFMPLSQVAGTTYLDSEDEWKIYSTNERMTLTFIRCKSRGSFESLVAYLNEQEKLLFLFCKHIGVLQ